MACCYSGCSNTRKKNPDLTFFRFPKERYRSYLWIKKCCNANIENLSHYELQYRVVCEEHFSSRCFDVSHLTSGKTRRSLFKFAVPEPSSLIKEEEQKNENYRPTALVEPPALPLKMHQSKGNDLASPSLLMSMAENLCPMMRPISPTPSDLQDETLMAMLSSNPLLPPLSPSGATHFSAAASGGNKEDTTPPYLESSLPPEKAKSLKSKFKSLKHERKGKRKLSSSPPSNQNTSLAHSLTTRSGKYLKILPKSNPKEIVAVEEEVSEVNQSENCKIVQRNPATQLNLDNGSFVALPTICDQCSITELSLANNKIDTLIWFAQMTNLKILKLQNNHISDVEALSKLPNLVFLDLSGNQISSLLKYKPTPECQLQHLDLSSNQITDIGCLKTLSQLIKLFLFHNKINTLKHWGNLLPSQLRELALAKNSILNLQDISELRHLVSLESLTIANNPCLNDVIIIDSEKKVLNSPISFYHVPYILYWCSTLTEIDGKNVTVQDSLKVNWLKKDGNIKKLMSEDKGKLLTFLSAVCPAEAPPIMKSNDSEIVLLLPPTLNVQPCALTAFELPNNKEVHLPKSTELESADIANCGVQPSKRQANKRVKDISKQGCVPSSCDHYIELIEEKARCHKLQRKNEELLERIQFLESIIDANQIMVNDLDIKVEEEYE